MHGRMTVGQAAEYLKVSRTKVWKLIGEGVLSATQNPLDKREKLIPADEVRRLGEHVQHSEANGSLDEPGSRVRRRFRSDAVANNPNAPRSDRLESYLREHWHAPR